MSPIVNRLRIAAHRIGERRRLAPRRVLAIERKDGQLVRREIELALQCRLEFVPEHLGQFRIVLGHVNLEDFPVQTLRRTRWSSGRLSLAALAMSRLVRGGRLTVSVAPGSGEPAGQVSDALGACYHPRHGRD
jgi:hypothetical protein